MLVGHSYGGAVTTEAGTHPNVAALVYIAAFVPDKGESVNTLLADPAPGAVAAAERAGQLSDAMRPALGPCRVTPLGELDAVRARVGYAQSRAVGGAWRQHDSTTGPGRWSRASWCLLISPPGTTCGSARAAEVTTDRAPTCPRVLDELLPAAHHATEQYADNPRADHGRLKSRLRTMRGLKRRCSARVISTGHAFLHNQRRGHYELGVDADIRYPQRSPNSLSRSEKPIDNSLASRVRADATVPNYWLGGKDNYEVDRTAGEEYIRLFP